MLRLRACGAGSRGRDASGISGTGFGGGIMPWSGLPQRHGERWGVTATGSTGSCGVAGPDVSEALEAFDLDARDARRSRTRASRRRTRACAAPCLASASSAFASSSDDDDDPTTPGLESPAARSMTGHAAGISTVRDSSVEGIVTGWLECATDGICSKEIVTGLDCLDSEDATVSGTGEEDHIASAKGGTADNLSFWIGTGFLMNGMYFLKKRSS